MIRLNKDKYINNVVFDYRACGSSYYPEQEVTIHSDNIEITGDDVMVYSKKWMSLNQYISKGGNPQDLIDGMKK